MRFLNWLCLLGGHNFVRYGNTLVCDSCGKRVGL